MSDGIDKLRFLNRDLANEVVAAAGTPAYAYDMATLKKQAENALAFRKSHLARSACLCANKENFAVTKQHPHQRNSLWKQFLTFKSSLYLRHLVPEHSADPRNRIRSAQTSMPNPSGYARIFCVHPEYVAMSLHVPIRQLTHVREGTRCLMRVRDWNSRLMQPMLMESLCASP
jgi:hypothetical protein